MIFEFYASLSKRFLPKNINFGVKNYDEIISIVKYLESAGKVMTSNFFQNPKINLTGHIQNGMGDMGLSPMQSSMSSISTKEIDAITETPSTNFKGVMSGLAQNLNQNLNAPDQLLKESMAGNSDVDIHDVMTAMAKAEISVNIATQVTSKVIQAYDKIMQISV